MRQSRILQENLVIISEIKQKNEYKRYTKKNAAVTGKLILATAKHSAVKEQVNVRKNS